MLRINASGVVAPMKDTEFIWNGAKMQSVREAMGSNFFLLLIDPNSSVPFTVKATLPNPTRLLFADFAPKEFVEGGYFSAHKPLDHFILPAFDLRCQDSYQLQRSLSNLHRNQFIFHDSILPHIGVKMEVLNEN
jgi:hypothetical protein